MQRDGLAASVARPAVDEANHRAEFGLMAGRALTECGFSAPAADEVCVLVGDGTAWRSCIGCAEEWLSPAERARAARLHFESDRTTYILAHAWWRLSLGICLGVDARRIPLISTAAGQPKLPGTALSTSLSHSGDWWAVAICAGATVGIDIECTPSRTRLHPLMPSICTPSEMLDLEPLPPIDREAALLLLWTRKEALLKAFGVGLNVEPSLLSATTDGLVQPIPCPVADGQIPCRVVHPPWPQALVGALALPESVTTTRVCRLGPCPPEALDNL